MQLWDEYPGVSSQPGTREWDTPATQRWRRFGALCCAAAEDGAWGVSDMRAAHLDDGESAEPPFTRDVAAMRSEELRAAMRGCRLWSDVRSVVLHRRATRKD